MDSTRRSSGVSHQTAENGSTARPLRGAYGRYDNLFFSRKERHEALANARSLAIKCRCNDIGALLLLLCKRFSAVSQTDFSELFFPELSNSLIKKKEKGTVWDNLFRICQISVSTPPFSPRWGHFFKNRLRWYHFYSNSMGSQPNRFWSCIFKTIPPPPRRDSWSDRQVPVNYLYWIFRYLNFIQSPHKRAIFKRP